MQFPGTYRDYTALNDIFKPSVNDLFNRYILPVNNPKACSPKLQTIPQKIEKIGKENISITPFKELSKSGSYSNSTTVRLEKTNVINFNSSIGNLKNNELDPNLSSGITDDMPLDRDNINTISDLNGIFQFVKNHQHCPNGINWKLVLCKLDQLIESENDHDFSMTQYIHSDVTVQSTVKIFEYFLKNKQVIIDCESTMLMFSVYLKLSHRE